MVVPGDVGGTAEMRKRGLFTSLTDSEKLLLPLALPTARLKLWPSLSFTGFTALPALEVGPLAES